MNSWHVDFVLTHCSAALSCPACATECAGHSCEHELETARINGVLGNMDANTGASQQCWLLLQQLRSVGVIAVTLAC